MRRGSAPSSTSGKRPVSTPSHRGSPPSKRRSPAAEVVRFQGGLPMRTNWIAAAGLALAALAAPAPSQAKGNDDLTIECPAEGLEIMALVTMARDVTGEPFFFDEKDLKDVRIQFQGKMVVPKAKFMAFFDFCMRSADFVPLETTEAGTRVHLLRKLNGQGGGRNGAALKTLARIVEPAELAQLADRWTLVTTTYSCKNLD